MYCHVALRRRLTAHHTQRISFFVLGGLCHVDVKTECEGEGEDERWSEYSSIYCLMIVF